MDDAGTLVPGASASFAVWDVEPGALGADGLPSPDAPDPRCRRTVVAGRTVFAAD
jgi:predicted amidohydrolase YtcJ